MIYVDDYKWRVQEYGKSRWPMSFSGHLFSVPPDDAALVAFGESIGLKADWLQFPGTPKAHFDVTDGKKLLAVRKGAVRISFMDGARLRHCVVYGRSAQFIYGLRAQFIIDDMKGD
jgi:hypothetical protein